MNIKNRLKKLEAITSTKVHKERKIVIVQNVNDEHRIQKYKDSGHQVTVIRRRKRQYT